MKTDITYYIRGMVSGDGHGPYEKDTSLIEAKKMAQSGNEVVEVIKVTTVTIKERVSLVTTD